MFKNLFNFSYKRNKKEALGFYLAYLALTIAAAMMCAGILGTAAGIGDAEGFDFGIQVGSVVAAVASVLISFLIVKQKKIFSFSHVLLVILSGAVALFVGGLGGLIPAAYLTTRENFSKIDSAPLES